jgi:hypothetical protein
MAEKGRCTAEEIQKWVKNGVASYKIRKYRKRRRSYKIAENAEIQRARNVEKLISEQFAKTRV